ncbi:MAG TPA: serine protease [Candidatus Stackebrandtia excrementipullorum]|nr:serine protease [Candidatus Stackebrandtia excrementipullorum]
MRTITSRLIAVASAVFIGVLSVGVSSVPASADDTDGPGTNIVGGETADEGEYPWMVRLSMGCGGSLLTDQIVLTAAHCVDSTGPDTSITASYGSVDLDAPEIVDYQSEYVHRSPAYGTDGVEDWALILLSEPVADAHLLAIAESDVNDSGDFEIMGWGADSEGGPQQSLMLKATVPFVDDVECGDAYGSSFDGPAEICAGLPEGGVDACQGDSGGPMIARDASGEAVQVGIVSWGYGCARAGYPGVYAQVSYSAADILAAADELAAV